MKTVGNSKDQIFIQILSGLKLENRHFIKIKNIFNSLYILYFKYIF